MTCTEHPLDARLCANILHIHCHLVLPFLLGGGDNTHFADVKTEGQSEI